MILTLIRRILLIVVGILLLVNAAFLLAAKSKPVETPKAYKVKAYCNSMQKAESLQMSLKGMGFEGNIVETKDYKPDFAGFIVVQYYRKEISQEKQAASVQEYLKLKGYDARISSQNGEDDKLRLQIGQIYRRQDDARRVSGSIFKNAGIKFEVKKYYRNIQVPAYILAVGNLKTQETAEDLKSKFEKVAYKVTILSYTTEEGAKEQGKD